MSDEEHLRDKASLEAYAEAHDLVVRYPGPRELFLDIDDEPSFARFKLVQLPILQEVTTGDGLELASLVSGYTVTPSPSGTPGHYHVVVTLNRDVRDAYERIALQALLGSDLKHEMISWTEAATGAEVPTCFFEKPDPLQPGEST